ncbi:MAG: DUF456 domain-containing protein [Planctomycetota bacterium]
MVPDILLIVVGAVGVLAGLVGCVLPVLPGPPLSFLGFLALWAARGGQATTFGGTTVAVLGAAAALVTVLDTAAPAMGARRYGASKLGLWGSILGMVVGLFFFPPFGMVLGAWVGALAGEAVAGKPWGQAWHASWGVFVFTMLGVALKLAVSGVIAWTFVAELLA